MDWLISLVAEGPPDVPPIRDVDPDEFQFVIPSVGVTVRYSALVSPVDQRLAVAEFSY